MKKEDCEVYIAGPLFNSEENDHNKQLARMFRDAGYDVFNPIEDGIEGASQMNTPAAELVKTIYELDRKRVRQSRIFVANVNGPQVDDGTAVEIGIASESQKARQEQNLDEGVEVMIGYFNDTRSLTPNMPRNPLVLGPFLREPNTVLRTREEVLDYALSEFPPHHPSTAK